MHRSEITNHLDQLLKPTDFNDHCPNGLQVEGKENLTRLITGVTACVDLINAARTRQADGILVHHGLIWDFANPIYKGAYKERIKTLLLNDINLWAYHLPIDANPQFGNNAILARILGLRETMPFGEYNGQMIGIRGTASEPEPEYYFEKIKQEINPQAIIFPEGPKEIKTVAIISGGAQKEFTQAINQGADLYLTGEISEYNLHLAKEEQVHFISAGHHATERFGVKRIGEALGEEPGLEVEFVDIPNPA